MSDEPREHSDGCTRQPCSCDATLNSLNARVAPVIAAILAEVTRLEADERDEYGEIEVVTRHMSPECERIVWDVLAEAAWLDANPEHFHIMQNERDLLVQEAALCIRKALRLSKEGT